jgi:hypothetical protein
MRVADRLCGDTATASHPAGIAQCRMPLLNVERPKPLQLPAAQEWHDLVLDQLAIAFDRPSRNRAGGFPLAHAGPHEFSDCDLAWLNVRARGNLGENLGGFLLRLPSRSSQRDKFCDASAGSRIASDIKFQSPAKLSASGQIAFHFLFPPC